MSRHSMLRLVPIEQQHQWDAFISTSPSGHLLQSWGWGELKQAQAGIHFVSRFGIRNENK